MNKALLHLLQEGIIIEIRKVLCMLQQKVKRSSNIELLRVVAMLMIIIYHITLHKIGIQLTDPSSIDSMKNGLFCHPLFYKKLLILSMIMPMGSIGNAIFILISGYFMVRKGPNIKLDRIGKKLLFQQGFAAIVLVIGSTLFHFIKKNIGTTLLGIQIFNSMAWFVGYYFAVMVIAALFLNRYLANLDQKQYLILVITLFAIIQFGWSSGLLESLSTGLGTLVTGVFLYALGGYIQRYNPFQSTKTNIILLCIVIVNFFICISAYNSTITAIQNYINIHSKEPFVQSQCIPGYQNYSIVAMILSVCLFEIFRRIHIPHIKIINFLGGATFMVYLIHDNDFYYGLWNTQDWITLLYWHPYSFILKLLLWAGMTFGSGVAFYILYLGVKKVILRIKENQSEKILIKE
jgi:hypothetical protein